MSNVSSKVEWKLRHKLYQVCKIMSQGFLNVEISDWKIESIQHP